MTRIVSQYKSPVVLLLFLVSVAQTSLTQSEDQAKAPIETFHSATRLVVLDVVVTDKAGHPIKNMTRDDFTVLEDGVPQNVTSFEAPEPDLPILSQKPDKETKTAAATGVESSRSLDIIVLDELNSEFLDQAYARVSIEKFLRKHGPQLRNPTSLLILGQKRLELLHDYTHDAGALLIALHNRRAELPFGLMSAELTSSGERLAKALSGLQLIAEANVHSAGRKNVIWVGPGFPALNANFLTQYDDVRGPVRDTGNLLLDARIVVYTVDPRGLEITPASYGLYDFGDQTSGELIFEQIAPATGGRIFRLGNDVDVEIADSITDGSAYYTLSYYPSNRDWNRKFRRVQITLKRQELIARTRRGYFGSPEMPPDDRELDTILSRAVVSPFSYRALGVQATAKVSGSQRQTGRFRILVDRQHLEWRTLQNGDHRCEITVVEASMSNSGEVIAHSVKEMEGIVEARKFTKEWNKPMVFALTSEIPAKTSRFRIVVRDYLSGDIGTTDVLAQVQPH